MTACTFCGRENDPASRFCIDCGKPMSSARVVSAYASTPTARANAPAGGEGEDVSRGMAGPAGGGGATLVGGPLVPAAREGAGAGTAVCPRCARTVDAELPFCGHCGSRVTASASSATCANCGASYTAGVDVFCARCGERVGQRVSRAVGSPLGSQVLIGGSHDVGPRIAVLDDSGGVSARYTLDRGEAVIGRGDADIRFDDVYLSPLHARLELREGELWVRDLGSRNGTWTFIEEPTRLSDGDVLLVGSQLLRFRRLGYPGPHPPEADSTRRLGSLTPSADVAVLEQLRADGSVRDSFHLSPARNVQLGRESGDWVFPYDQTMSGRHAEIRSQDAEFYVHDSGSRNGVALAVHGDRPLQKGQRILLGDQVLRIESVDS